MAYNIVTVKENNILKGVLNMFKVYFKICGEWICTMKTDDVVKARRYVEVQDMPKDDVMIII